MAEVAAGPRGGYAHEVDALGGSDASAGDEVMEEDHSSEDEHDDDDEEEEEEHEDVASVTSALATAPQTYPHLREISSLAHWTVSSQKPGCGIEALLATSTDVFWQSDGPQPHYLNIHFTRWVSIAHMHLYLDYSADESYTPTKIQVWAGTGYHDLQMLTEMELERPKGWIAVDLAHAGGKSEFDDDDNEDDLRPTTATATATAGSGLSLPSDPTKLANPGHNGTTAAFPWTDFSASRPNGSGAAHRTSLSERERAILAIGRGPTLRCFLVQLRILENHQNGKDTHLRGIQIFAKDHEYAKRRRRLRQSRIAASASKPVNTTGTLAPKLSKTKKHHDWVEQVMSGLGNGVGAEEAVIR